MSAVPAPSYYRMTVAEFRRRAFLGKPPSANTIKAAIERKEWLGEQIGGLWFIFVDAVGQPIRSKPAPPKTGNDGADRLIMEWQSSK